MDLKLRAIMIGSENPDKLGEFYTKILGEPDWKMEGWYGFKAGNCSIMVGPHSEVKGKNQSPGRMIFNFDSDDVESDFEKVKATGAEVIAKPYQPDKDDPSMQICTFADPDGNYFQLATPWKEK